MLHSYTYPGRSARVWTCDQPVQVGKVLPDVYLSSYGRNQCDGSFRFEQIYKVYACHLFEEGAGVFELDGQPYEIEPGHMVLIRPGVHARYFDHADRPWRYRWFVLGGARVAAALADSGMREERPVLDWDWPSQFASVFERIEAVYRAETVCPVQAVALGWELMAGLAEAYATPQAATTETLAVRARFIMQQEYSRGLQVEELARRLRVSRATLFRQFEATFGQSPKRHLDEIRLTQAQDLLRRSHSSIKEVARACGFRCARYFSRAYHRRFGKTPSATRKAKG